MLSKVYGSAVFGIEASTVVIEVNVDQGVGYHLVGLPDNAIKESNYRIAAALINNGYRIPGKKITVNMAPADLRKEGAAYDLPIAMAILSASDQIKSDKMSSYMMMGELSLDGKIQPIRGALPIALQAAEDGFKGLFVPAENAEEAAIVSGIAIYAVSHINAVIEFFDQDKILQALPPPKFISGYNHFKEELPDFSEVRGQETVKRCMEIAAAGAHNILLIGPPGSGKTMLAKRLPGILPPMTLAEALETTKIHSVVGAHKEKGLIGMRPFRSPHHTISDVALVGGGSYPQPGEISLAHNGVLFLDELPEFKRSVLEVMRQPLEDREVTISRARFTLTYPSSFMLVASMNPSPGGYFLDSEAPKPSSIAETQRYLNRISGPLLDRVDLHIEVTPVPFDQLSARRNGESSQEIRQRVMGCRRIQQQRFKDRPGIHSNAQMSSRLIREFCPLNKSCLHLLKSAMDKLKLSARAYDRILKVSRTIADLDAAETIQENHLAEAIQYRSLDREGWMG